MEIPPHLHRAVRESIRRHQRAGWSRRLSRERKKIGKQITQWRKAQSQTVATASAAPSMISNLQTQLDVANQRIEELELINELLKEELESLRQHETELGIGLESSYSPSGQRQL